MTFNMDEPFSQSNEWLCCSTSEIQYWNNHPTHPEDIVGVIDAPETLDYPVDPAWESLSSTAPEDISLSSGQSTWLSPGQVSLDISDFAQEAAVVQAAFEPFQTGSVSSSPYSSGSHITMNSYVSFDPPYYASWTVDTPESIEPERPFHGDDESYLEGHPPENLPYHSSDTMSNCEQEADAGTRQIRTPGARGKKSRGKSTAVPSQVRASEGEVSIACLSCLRKFSCSSSLHRHRKESCGSESEPGRFQCDARYHPGCKRSFQRRCHLKDHYKKLGFTEKQADAKVRERYSKGMHRRRN